MTPLKTLSVIRIPRTLHQKQMHQFRQELNSLSKQATNHGRVKNTDRVPGAHQVTRAGRLNTSNRR